MSSLSVIRTFKDLIVWQRAFALVVAVYEATEALPSHERYGLTAELRKTARSVAALVRKLKGARGRGF